MATLSGYDPSLKLSLCTEDDGDSFGDEFLSADAQTSGHGNSDLMCIIKQVRGSVESVSRNTSFLDSQSSKVGATKTNKLVNAPLFSIPESLTASEKMFDDQEDDQPPNQFGLIGIPSQHQYPKTSDDMPRLPNILSQTNMIFANMDMPWSAFICGSQGAGKSHTLSCLLENALLESEKIGKLHNPLTAMVFHYDNFTNGSFSQVCEAAYLCSAGVPVTILVSPSNIWGMTKLYTNLPRLPSGSPVPKIAPLYLPESRLDVSTMLKLMAIDPHSNDVPLYMETVMSILREMAMEGKSAGSFSYSEFRNRLDEVQWVPGQRVPLSLRLQLLDSFLEPTVFTKTTRPAPSKDDIWKFKPGQLTIVDLSDPFVGSNDACSLFSICLSLFMAGRGDCGRVIALDEAHKFLVQNGAARTLTNDLTSLIRQQRHTGTRVLISTQEPTLSPELIDLSNVTFIHRFLSPAWYEVLRKHLAGIAKYEKYRSKTSLLEVIVTLDTGEALCFCPTAVLANDFLGEQQQLSQRTLGTDFIKIKIRQRLTEDGGKSILASEVKPITSSVATNDIFQDIPMHVVQKTGTVEPGNNKSKNGPSILSDDTNKAPISTFKQTHQVHAELFPSDKVISSTTRREMRKFMREAHWNDKGDILWNKLTASVEEALDQKPKSLRNEKRIRHLIRAAGVAEFESHS